MKTITYNAEKEIRVGIMIAIIITAVFTTLKVKELQINNSNSAQTMRADPIGITNSSYPALPLADARLIEEPVQAAGTTTTSNAASENGIELAVQMKTWINNKAYWNAEEAESEKVLGHFMTTCLKNGTFFSDEAFDELPAENEKELSLKMISNLKYGNYFSDESFDEVMPGNRSELAGQMKLTLASGNYWIAD